MPDPNKLEALRNAKFRVLPTRSPHGRGDAAVDASAMTEPLALTAGGCTWFRMNLAQLRSEFKLPGHLLIGHLDRVFAELSHGTRNIRLSDGYRVEDPIAAEILYHVARLAQDRLAAPPRAIQDLLVQLGVLGGISVVDLLAGTADSLPP